MSFVKTWGALSICNKKPGTASFKKFQIWSL